VSRKPNAILSKVTDLSIIISAHCGDETVGAVASRTRQRAATFLYLQLVGKSSPLKIFLEGNFYQGFRKPKPGWIDQNTVV